MIEINDTIRSSQRRHITDLFVVEPMLPVHVDGAWSVTFDNIWKKKEISVPEHSTLSWNSIPYNM